MFQPFFVTEKIDFADGLYYNSYAIGEILNDEEWKLQHPKEIDDLRAPVYPLLLATVYLFFGIENFKAVYLFQTILSIFVAYLIYLLSYQIFRNKKMAYLSLLWSLCYIPYIRYSAMLGRESLIFFLFILSFYLGLKFLINRERKYVLGFSISFLFLVHTDPRYLLFIPTIFIPLYDFYGLKIGLTKFFKFLFLFCFLMTPWTVRNYYYYGGFVIVSPKYLDFREQNTFETQEDFKNSYSVKDFIMNSMGFGRQTYTIKSEKDIILEDERQLILKGINNKNRTDKEIQAVKNGKYPADNYISKRIWMFKQFWRVTNFSGDFFPYPSGIFNIWSLKHNLSNIVLYGSLLPFFIFSLMHNFRKRKLISRYFFYIIMTQSLIHTFIWSRERYRHPIDALIIIFGIHGMFLTYKYLKKSKIGIYLK